jgi:hypothetical protein
MAVTYRILESVDLVHTTWAGRVTFEESLAYNEALLADPSFDPSMRQLSDARTAESEVSGDGIRALARRSAFGPGSRRAILVQDDALFGVSRMYEAQTKGAGEVQVFRDEAEALEWLGLDGAVLKAG